MSGSDGYETVDEAGDTPGLEEEEEDSFVVSMAPRAQGAIRRVGLEGLVWWERGLRWLQGLGGGRGVLCTVNDVASLLVEKQGLVEIPVKYVK